MASTSNAFKFKLFLRTRPQKDGKTELLDFYKPLDDNNMLINIPKDTASYRNGRIEGKFEFNRIFKPEDNQVCVFNETTKDLLDGFINGVNCLIMAYGVTGSGKTYTIIGDNEKKGIVPQALEYILSAMNSPSFKDKHKEDHSRISLDMSFLEDYQNNIYDLLSTSNRGNERESLRTLSDGIQLRIVGLTETSITTVEDGLNLLDIGKREKHVAETRMNMDSSRSHTMCFFSIVRNNGNARTVLSTCRIVDLAGSERASKTDATGKRLQEAGAINNDLMNLNMCLSELSKPNGKPYFRRCKLTHILSSSMTGPMAGPVSMIVNVSNDLDDFEETFNTLEKTTIVKEIKTVVSKVNSKLPPVRTAGGRMFSPTVNHPILMHPNPTPHIISDEMETMKKAIREKDELIEKLREMQSIQNVEKLEIQLRAKIITEIQRRESMGRSEEDSSSFNNSFLIMEGEWSKRLEDCKTEYEMKILELCSQIRGIEEENIALTNMNNEAISNDEKLRKIEELKEEKLRSDESILYMETEMKSYEAQIAQNKKDLEDYKMEIERLKKENEELLKKVELPKEPRSPPMLPSGAAVMLSSQGFMQSRSLSRSSPKLSPTAGMVPPPLPTTIPMRRSPSPRPSGSPNERLLSSSPKLPALTINDMIKRNEDKNASPAGSPNAKLGKHPMTIEISSPTTEKSKNTAFEFQK